MKERFSNVLAWLGLAYPAILLVNYLIYLMGFETVSWAINNALYPYPDDIVIFIVVGLYPFCAVFNYLLVGRFRLLPWVKE